MAIATPLIALIESCAPSLSASQRVLARHVLANYQAVAFATISELARASGVSEATIVRFANALGFRGYPAFQKEVRRIVRADLKGTERFHLTAPGGGAKEGPLKTIIAKEMENIAHLDAGFDAEALGRAADAITRAREVVVVGARATASLAQHLWFALDKLGLPATRLLAADSEATDRIDRLDHKSCVIVIGFPRYLRGLATLLDLARARGVRTIVVTDSPFSALKGDIGLYAPAESASFVAFHCAPLILINALVDTVSRSDRRRTLRALKRFEARAETARYFQPT